MHDITMKLTIPKEANHILTVLSKAGFEGYIVGGCVRDLLSGRMTTDWDFTTDATPEEIQKLFPDSFYDNKFGTVGIPLKKPTTHDLQPKTIFEVTTFRSESGYTDHRHPDKISWGETLEEDLKRRDFTINAMAYDGKNLIDLFDGQQDLKNKIIRAVGNPNDRFAEDALRMIRAIRFATQLQFTIDGDTFLGITKNSGLIKNISTERIRDELLKIMSSSYPVIGIKFLRNTKLLSLILPELEKCFGVEQKSPQRHHVDDVGTHLVKSLENCPSEDPLVRLATLLHDVGKAVTFNKTPEGVITFYNHEIIGSSIMRNIADRLHFSKKDRDHLTNLVRYHQFTVDERQTDSAIRRFIRNVGRENINDMLSLRTGDRLGGGARETSWRLELYKKRIEEVQIQPFSVADLKADGRDVMEIYGIGPGPLVGAVLNMLFNDVEKNLIKNERDVLLKRIKDFSASPIPPKEQEEVRR